MITFKLFKLNNTVSSVVRSGVLLLTSNVRVRKKKKNPKKQHSNAHILIATIILDFMYSKKKKK